ncbi:MAG: bile acid:sodium symporter family protein [Candidatus Pelagadaptatus aseana]|uniref:bile acid:sodium symporter family protein n=1 Tax=Candidatus Pelagadaptatus aseana TaxID=3120508 RepID=UPI0039B329D4
MFAWYLANEYWFAATQLTLAMLGMGATLKVSDFRDVLREPKAVLIGLMVQLIAVPLMTWGIIQTVSLEAGVLVGLALIAAIPGGTVSNIYTYLARGNIPLSISITAVTTLGCLVSTPIIMGLLISEYMPADFEMPAAQIAIEIAVFLLLPLMLGMLCYHLFPKRAELISKWGVRGSMLVIVAIVIGSAGAGRLDTEAFGLDNMLIIGGFFVGLILVGAIPPAMAGLSRPDTVAIEVEVAVRNTNLGLLIKASLFPAVAGQMDPVGDFVLFTLLLYGALQIFIGLLWAAWRRYQIGLDSGSAQSM